MPPTRTPAEVQLRETLDALTGNDCRKRRDRPSPRLERGPLIGRMSNGSVMTAQMFPLPDGGPAQIPVQDFVRGGGRLIEGVGVEPDIWLLSTLADVRAGRDPALERAIDELRRAAKTVSARR